MVKIAPVAAAVGPHKVQQLRNRFVQRTAKGGRHAMLGNEPTIQHKGRTASWDIVIPDNADLTPGAFYRRKVDFLMALFGVQERTAQRWLSTARPGEHTLTPRLFIKPEMREQFLDAVLEIEDLAKHIDADPRPNILWMYAANSVKSEPLD